MISKDMLKNFDFFSNMNEEKLAEISKLSETHEYNSGDIIFNQGEKAENIYGLLDGEVELRAVFNYKTITKKYPIRGICPYQGRNYRKVCKGCHD